MRKARIRAHLRDRAGERHVQMLAVEFSKGKMDGLQWVAKMMQRGVKGDDLFSEVMAEIGACEHTLEKYAGRGEEA
jgi:hypothetical protein